MSRLRAIRQAEVGASQTMIERTEACFGIKPEWLAADTAYGSAANLDWLVNEQGIAPHVPVIDKSQREDGTFSREDFVYDEMRDIYMCPAGQRARAPVSRLSACVSRLPAQSEVLPEHASATDRARCERGRTRCRPGACQNAGIRAITPRSQEGRDAVCAPQAHSAT
jgi:hypothetical protein